MPRRAATPTTVASPLGDRQLGDLLDRRADGLRHRLLHGIGDKVGNEVADRRIVGHRRDDDAGDELARGTMEEGMGPDQREDGREVPPESNGNRRDRLRQRSGKGDVDRGRPASKPVLQLMPVPDIPASPEAIRLSELRRPSPPPHR
jgi:hypothetical protein